MKWILFVWLSISSVFVSAQDSSTVVVHIDQRVDLLIKKQVEINESTTREARRFVPGFRILILSTNDRNKAMETKTRVYKNFPELKAYLIYQSPYFKLKVGNFKDQREADTYLKRMQYFFPTGIYIIRDLIEVNPDKSVDSASR